MALLLIGVGCTDLAHSVRHTRFLPGTCGAVTTVVVGLLLLSTALAMTTLDPITVTIFAVVFSATVLPLTFLPVLLVGNDRQVMGQLANGRLSNTLGTVTLAISTVAALAALPLLVLTRGGSS